MKHLIFALSLALLTERTLWADDSMGIATPEEQKAFDSILSRSKAATRFSKKPSGSAVPIQAPQEGDALPESETGNVSRRTQGGTTPALTSREEVALRAIEAVREGNLSGFRATLANASRARLGTDDRVRQLKAAASTYATFKLIDERTTQSVPGSAGGAHVPLIQIYSASIQGKALNGREAHLFSLQIVCGMKTDGLKNDNTGRREVCYIQEIE